MDVDRRTLAKRKFLNDAIFSASSACKDIHHKNFDIGKAAQQSETKLTPLEVEDALQAMLASQMLAIHKLQQTSMVLINGLPFGESSKYYTNTAIKLSNTFTQQANFLAKLQGGFDKKSLSSVSMLLMADWLRDPGGLNMKTTPCNGKITYAFNKLLRCGAKTRQGTPCRSPAVKNRPRCRFHGCGKGNGAPKGNTYTVTHDHSTAGIKAFKRVVRQVLKDGRQLEKMLG